MKLNIYFNNNLSQNVSNTALMVITNNSGHCVYCERVAFEG